MPRRRLRLHSIPMHNEQLALVYQAIASACPANLGPRTDMPRAARAFSSRTLSGASLRSSLVLEVDTAASEDEYTILSAARQIAAKSCIKPPWRTRRAPLGRCDLQNTFHQ